MFTEQVMLRADTLLELDAMRSGTAGYFAVAAILAISTLIYVCMCERLGCTSNTQQYLATASGGLDHCCGASDAKRHRGGKTPCCRLLDLEAVAPPASPQGPDDLPADALLAGPETGLKEAAREQHERARDGPARRLAVDAVAPRLTRAPPFAT